MSKAGEAAGKFLKSGKRAIFVEGIDASGKTYFAKHLKKILKMHGKKAVVVCLDDFLHDEKRRIANGKSSAREYFESWFDFKLLRRSLLDSFFAGKCIKNEIPSYNEKTKKRKIRKLRIENSDILILDGVFLSNKILRSYPAYRIYLEVPYELSLERQLRREPRIRKLAKEEIIFRWENWHLPAHRSYIKKFRPKDKADIVIDNSNPERR